MKATVSIKVSYTLIQASVDVAHEGWIEHFIRDPQSSLSCEPSQIHFVVEVEDRSLTLGEADTVALEDEQELEYNEEEDDTDALLRS